MCALLWYVSMSKKSIIGAFFFVLWRTCEIDVLITERLHLKKWVKIDMNENNFSQVTTLDKKNEEILLSKVWRIFFIKTKTLASSGIMLVSNSIKSWNGNWMWEEKTFVWTQTNFSYFCLLSKWKLCL